MDHNRLHTWHKRIYLPQDCILNVQLVNTMNLEALAIDNIEKVLNITHRGIHILKPPL